MCYVYWECDTVWCHISRIYGTMKAMALSIHRFISWLLRHLCVCYMCVCTCLWICLPMWILWELEADFRMVSSIATSNVFSTFYSLGHNIITSFIFSFLLYKHPYIPIALCEIYGLFSSLIVFTWICICIYLYKYTCSDCRIYVCMCIVVWENCM